MGSDDSIAGLLRIHRGSAEPEELAAITVVVACLAGRAAAPAPAPPRPPGRINNSLGRRKWQCVF
ncbi:acyl-CoA carboxylase subunit epsilon, partial [Streptomyces sp. NPDC127110]|uniref:acyl-CoA carboxylase subunit epsilon n=1 Tax=Streptomyces sp. NPDC127110 TaxID=3345362 RepID=UPI00362AF906